MGAVGWEVAGVVLCYQVSLIGSKEDWCEAL